MPRALLHCFHFYVDGKNNSVPVRALEISEHSEKHKSVTNQYEFEGIWIHEGNGVLFLTAHNWKNSLAYTVLGDN